MNSSTGAHPQSSSSSTFSSATVPAVSVRNIVKRFGDFQALSGVSLDIRQGELFSLLGPSGCGKTTLLRIIAGLDWPTAGEVEIDGVDTLPVPAHLRPVNTVFQSYALFPHLSVRDNVSFGLRMKEVPEAEVKKRVNNVMEMVQIEALADRKPSQLSGGQQQRVALARAVVNEPKVLLLDEPLGALDLKLRKQLQVELLALQRRLGITFIFVTHDQEEALALSDRIAVFNKGLIEQVGDVESLYEFPRTRFASCFLGTSNLIDAKLISEDGNSARVSTLFGDLTVDLTSQPVHPSGRKELTLALRPEKVLLQRNGSGDMPNCVKARVQELLYIGSETHYILEAAGKNISAELMNTQMGSQGFEAGQEISLSMPPSALVVLDD